MARDAVAPVDANGFAAAIQLLVDALHAPRVDQRFAEATQVGLYRYFRDMHLTINNVPKTAPSIAFGEMESYILTSPYLWLELVGTTKVNYANLSPHSLWIGRVVDAVGVLFPIIHRDHSVRTTYVRLFLSVAFHALLVIPLINEKRTDLMTTIKTNLVPLVEAADRQLRSMFGCAQVADLGLEDEVDEAVQLGADTSIAPHPYNETIRRYGSTPHKYHSAPSHALSRRKRAAVREAALAGSQGPQNLAARLDGQRGRAGKKNGRGRGQRNGAPPGGATASTP
jgi:hypothetical protein